MVLGWVRVVCRHRFSWETGNADAKYRQTAELMNIGPVEDAPTFNNAIVLNATLDELPRCARDDCRVAWARRSFTDASEHENCGPLLRSEAHVAFVYKADHASGIERVGIENLLILFATRAAGRLIAGPCDDPNRPSAGAGARRTSGTCGARRTSWAGRSGLTLGWRLALPARGQEKGS